MSQNLTNNALIYAILALNNEITLQKEYLDSDEVPSDERDNEQGILDDLEQAFMEFIDLSKSRCKNDETLPGIDELINEQL